MQVTVNYQTNSRGDQSVESTVTSHSTHDWHYVSETCDVTNCTYDSLMQAITELYIDGEITHKDFETFDIDKNNNDSLFVSRGFNVMTNPYRTPADSKGKRNWVKEFEIKYAEAKHRHDEKTAQIYESVVSILQRLSESNHENSVSA